ncbi:histone-lysine N-methyltransferase 2D-like [Amphibalanus amphitrite]|uniref:histone-lysine N-methyltransferase 2D-like n=1 Tax=Amphibalanus amphitrite TaxID=1232801 RepID=UPI001C8FB405|nr:histone-lysine N-methyltransferase 2D-like [Amphibalanus amphitrite]
MHPAPVCSVAMVPDLHVPQMSLAFGEPSMCQRGAPVEQTVLEPANDYWARLRPEPTSAGPLQTSLYPGSRPAVRAAPCPPCSVPCSAPLRSHRVSSSSDVKDLSQPLFVDTTVEYDLPKAAYPPDNSEPLLMVHPQYFEHLRHRRTLGAGCACQLCNFYGRRMPHGGQGEAAAAAAAAAVPAAPAVSVAPAASVSSTANVHQTFQKPEAPRHHWPRPFPQPVHQHQHHLLQQHQAAQRQLAAQQQQQQQQQAQQQAQQQQQQQQQLAQQPRYNCMVERQQRREAALGCTAAAFVTPTVSCDSDSGYSSVELEPSEWAAAGRQPQVVRSEAQVRDVLAKRKRRVEAATAAEHAAATAAKRLRVSYWPGGVSSLDMAPYLHRQPAVM